MRSGVQVLKVGFALTVAWLAAAIIPVPALRSLSLHAAIVSAFNSLAMLTLFPALLAFDLRRVAANKMDLFCCNKGPTISDNAGIKPETEVPGDDVPCQKWTLRHFVTHYWTYGIQKTPVKFVTLLVAFILTCCGLYGIAHIKQGMHVVHFKNFQGISSKHTT